MHVLTVCMCISLTCPHNTFILFFMHVPTMSFGISLTCPNFLLLACVPTVCICTSLTCSHNTIIPSLYVCPHSVYICIYLACPHKRWQFLSPSACPHSAHMYLSHLSSQLICDFSLCMSPQWLYVSLLFP